MPKPAPKGALRKAPSGPHPIAPPTAPSAESATPEAVDTGGTSPVAPAPPPAVTAEQEPAGAAQPSIGQAGGEQGGVEPDSAVRAASLPMFSVRMDPALRRQVKRWAAEHEVSLQALTAAALHEYMSRHNS
ncbi:hypothetical protein GCM10027586_17970 [Kineococcus gypseus]|uniref:hypothetical protein n=1 Tax=Kineococcus gypseus TaxID=1637102 RepID=UPI003D7C6025